MNIKFLVLGATGGLGYAVVKSLLEKGVPTTILVRDYEKAHTLFGTDPNLEITLGSVEDEGLLQQLSRDKSHIFHGLNMPYEKWKQEMPKLTTLVIKAAASSSSTVVFPGNNYNFGLITEPISEITPFQPNTALGKVRVQIERMLQEATRQKRIKTLVVRLPEIWGPNVTNKSFEPVFKNALKGKALPWLFNADVPQELAYNMDAGNLIVELALQEHKDYEVYHYAGTLFPSIKDFFKAIANASGQKLKVQVVSSRLLKVLGLLNPGMKAVNTLQYKFENTIMLDDIKLELKTGQVEETDLEEAIKTTLDWYANDYLAPKTMAKKKSRKRIIVDFVADNLSIGVFPILIAALAFVFPGLEAMTVLLGVVAGIYWSPLIRKLFRKIFIVKPLLVALLVWTTLGAELKGQETPYYLDGQFEGLYIGFSTGNQHVFGGALIDGLDVIGQKFAHVSELHFGYRKQFWNKRWLAGFEFQSGWTDGGMYVLDKRQNLDVFYQNDEQSGWGLMFGYVFGRRGRTLLTIFGNSTSRDFDISFREQNGTLHTQKDNQLFLRYGLALETVISRRFDVKASVNRLYVDFGDAVLSESLNKRLDFSLGIVYQF